MVNYLVTGVNKGIGLEIVKQLSRDPKNFIYGTVRSIEHAGAVTELPNVKLIEISLLASLEEIKKAFAIIDTLDIVIQNAGTANPNVFLTPLEIAEEEYVDLFEINFLGALKVYKAAYPYLFKDGKGIKKFIFVSSISASTKFLEAQNVGYNAYGVSKIGLNYITKEIAITNRKNDNEVIRNSVTFAIHPGALLTPLTEDYEVMLPGTFSPVDKGVEKVLQLLAKDDIESGAFYDATNGQKLEL